MTIIYEFRLDKTNQWRLYMPLVIAPLDRELVIKKVLLDDKTKKHLESLGVVTGGKITIISVHGGNVICIVMKFCVRLNDCINRNMLFS